MLVCLDVDYRGEGAVAAGLVFGNWVDASPTCEVVVSIGRVEPYEPGQFYRRELPCLLAVLESLERKPEVVIIDGYVWLGEVGEPGLGAHLHRAIEGTSAIVGVAKTKFLRARAVEEVFRGASRSPLHVTTVGIDLSGAAEKVRSMHGPHRIPTLLKRVDRLCRDSPGGEN